MGTVTSCLCGEESDIETTKETPNEAFPPPRQDECVNKDSVFYDARQSMTESMMDDVYRPAALPSYIARGSIIMEEPETLLQETGEHKQGRQPSMVVKHNLQDPQLRIDQRGYPGNLTPEELEAALDFRRALKTDEEKREIVEVFIPINIEDEPYALCRFLRGRNYNVESTLEMVGESVPYWGNFKKHDFYPTIEEAVDCPGNVLLSQYPYLFSGNAKNGCPLNYQMIGRMKMESLECITEPDRLGNYVMHSIIYQFTKQVKIAQQQDPTRLVRCECIAVIDLKGLDTSQLNKKTLATLKQLSHATGCFPELLNRMIVLNASYAFSFFWTMIKAFLEARTVSKIEIYTSEAKGKARLLELVEKKELLSDYGGSGSSFDELAQETGCASGATRQTSKLMQMNDSACTVVSLSKNEKASVRVYTRAEGSVTLSRDKTEIKTVDLTRPSELVLPYCTEIASGESGPGKLNVSASGPTSTDYLLVFVEVFPTG